MIKIIPAIDIIDGKAVRLSQGDYRRKKIYSEDPLEVAKMFEASGISRLHVVDLDGARVKRIVNYRALENIASKTSLIVDFGGGLWSDLDLKIAFNSGAKMIVGGSIAVKNPKAFRRWIDTFGSDCVVLGADCKEEKICISGWMERTNEEIGPFIKKWNKNGITQVICTDIGRDGMMNGVNVELYRQIQQEVDSIFLIASGGVNSISDVSLLQESGLSGVIIGKAIYEGKVQLKELEKYAS